MHWLIWLLVWPHYDPHCHKQAGWWIDDRTPTAYFDDRNMCSDFARVKTVADKTR
jgi:hypothetical protein